MTKSHPKYITTAAIRFLNDAYSATHRIYGYDESGKLYMANGNAIYVGKPIDGLPPECRADCVELLRPFIEKWEAELSGEHVFLSEDEMRLDRQKQKTNGIKYPVWRATLPNGMQAGFLWTRLTRANDLLQRGTMIIELPAQPLHAAAIRGCRGVVYQLPVRL